MDEKLYRQLVAVIRRHSFHIVVGDADGYHEFTNMGSGSGGTVLVRCLTLVAAYAYGTYPRGHTWYIPLSDLHRAIHDRAESDTDFMWRARRCGLDRYDVEKVVADATHGVIHLNMF